MKLRVISMIDKDVDRSLQIYHLVRKVERMEDCTVIIMEKKGEI